MVGGRLEPGKDRVAIFASLSALQDAQDNVIAGNETHLMLHKVPVVNVQVPASQASTASKDSAAPVHDTVPSAALSTPPAPSGPNPWNASEVSP